MFTFNLLPQAAQKRHQRDILNYYTLLGGIAVATGALLVAATLLLFDQVYRANLDTLKTQKTQAESQAALYLDVEKKAQELEKQLTSVQKAQGQTTRWASILSELQNLTPPSVSVNSLKLAQAGGASAPNPANASKTQVVGRADSRRSLGQFQLALSGSPYFKNVEIQTSTASSSSTAIDYTLSTEIDYSKLSGPAK